MSVVLQDEEFVLSHPHPTDPDDMRVDIAPRRDTDHLWQEGFVLRDQPGRRERFPAVIVVAQKRLGGADAMLDAPLQPRPLAAGQNAGMTSNGVRNPAASS